MGRIFRHTFVLIFVLATAGIGCASTSARIRSEPPQNTRAVNTIYGVASWYGGDFHGRTTASGERFNMYAYTAAHKTLPFGTIVRVTNLRNDRQTVVRINDRGPFARGREIDVSYKAACDLGMLETGLEKVRIEILSG